MTDTAVRIGRHFPLPPGFHGLAHFSADERYRYYLTRVWNPLKPKMLSIGMNPSSAGANQDDSTIRILERLAIRENHGSLQMLNAYALVSTDATALTGHPDPVGPDNDAWITFDIESLSRGTILACWGVIPQARHDYLVAKLKAITNVPVYCLGRTQGGFPRHPLRTKLTLERFI